MYSSYWTREEKDLSGQYNHAKNPWYKIDNNGKVDIGKENGDNDKISLEKSGAFKFVKDWIIHTDKRQISKEQREELIKLLSE